MALPIIAAGAKILGAASDPASAIFGGAAKYANPGANLMSFLKKRMMSSMLGSPTKVNGSVKKDGVRGLTVFQKYQSELFEKLDKIAENILRINLNINYGEPSQKAPGAPGVGDPIKEDGEEGKFGLLGQFLLRLGAFFTRMLKKVMNSITKGFKKLVNYINKKFPGIGKWFSRVGKRFKALGAKIAARARLAGEAIAKIASETSKLARSLISKLPKGLLKYADKLGKAFRVTGLRAAKSVANLKEIILKKIPKFLGKSIPGIGVLMGVGFGILSLVKGDWLGAGLNIGAGVASTLPGPGTAAAFALGITALAREVYQEVHGVFPEKDPNVGDKFKSILSEAEKIAADFLKKSEGAGAGAAKDRNDQADTDWKENRQQRVTVGMGTQGTAPDAAADQLKNIYTASSRPSGGAGGAAAGAGAAAAGGGGGGGGSGGSPSGGGAPAAAGSGGSGDSRRMEPNEDTAGSAGSSMRSMGGGGGSSATSGASIPEDSGDSDRAKINIIVDNTKKTTIVNKKVSAPNSMGGSFGQTPPNPAFA